MLSIEPVAWNESHEELGAVGSWAGVGHGEDAGFVVATVGFAFALELVTGATRAGAERTTALDHEVANDPVKAEPIVVTFLNEVYEISARDRRLISKQLNIDGAFVGFDNGS